MKKLLSPLLALLLTSCALKSLPLPEDWASVAVRTNQSLEQVLGTKDGQPYSCTGFVIDSQRGLVLTADHCIGEQMTADGELAWTSFEDPADDVAVIQTLTGKPALEAETAPVSPQDEVLATGFAYGFPVAQARVLRVAAPAVLVEELMDTFIMYDRPVIGGMSGGPVVNRAGKVISINQISNSESAISRSMARIYKATARYWRK